jgi:hypothetical protein
MDNPKPIEIAGDLGELRLTVTIKRAETGKEETFDLVGKIEPEKEPE